MAQIFMYAFAAIIVTIWLGFLIPQYAAWKNRRYKTVAICLTAFFVSVLAFAAMVIYGDFVTALLYGLENSRAKEANEAILCLLGFIWCVGHWFCWWYIYGRKSLDFIHFKGHTADELNRLISPELKKLMGLN